MTLWQEIRRGAAGAASDDSLRDFNAADGCASCVELKNQVAALGDELTELRRRRRLDADDLELDKAQFAAERREFEIQIAEFIATLEV